MEPLPENLPVYLVGTTYSGNNKSMYLIFYNEETCQMYYWRDKDHKPFCLSNLTPSELYNIYGVKHHPNLVRVEPVERFDALADTMKTYSKIIVSDPKAIGGGRPSECIRDIIENDGGKVYEGRIHYEEAYVYDKQLEMGMPYVLKYGFLERLNDEEIEKRIAEIQAKIHINDKRWLRYFEYPVPNFLRTAIDIEVLGNKNKVPNPNKAKHPVVSVSFVGSDNSRLILMLKRAGVKMGDMPVNGEIRFFNKESDLILAVFEEFKKYPLILSFNGDAFDMLYLHNRAHVLHIPKEQNPILVRQKGIKLRGNGLHVDLYKFFFNRSIQIYAFQGKYKNASLEEISQALLGRGKIGSVKDMPNWSYTELAAYNCVDSELTLELTMFDDDLLMKLIMALMRISAMGLEEMTRFQISAWIKGMMFYEHRRRNWIIPTPADIIDVKGDIDTQAIIKGKKYKGAIVVEPIAGVHFNVTVMDFASLYPSIYKTRNLGYSTINCNHPECKSNTVPETTHWVCTKNKAMESEIIGMMRDLRVFHYKSLGKTTSFYKVMEQTMKVIMNGSYGVFGDNRFSLYCPPVAESTTAIGRYSIQQTIDKAHSLGIIVLYGDTDSVFLKDPTKEQIKTLSDWSSKHLDLDLEAEKTYRYVCLSSRKKNYLCVAQDGRIDVKGMTGKKKHVPIIIRGAFDVTKKYLSEAKSEQEVEACKKALKQAIKNVYLRIKKRDFEIDEMAFRIGLGKNPSAYRKTIPQHVQAANMLEDEMGITLRKNDIVAYVKCMPFKHVSAHDEQKTMKVKPVELARPEDIDVDKYYEMLKSTFEQLLDALEIDYDSVLGVMRIDAFT